MKKRLIIFGIAVLIAAGTGVWVWERKQTMPDIADDNRINRINEAIKRLEEGPSVKSPEPFAVKDEVINGITITRKGDQKLILNSKQGYSIEVPSFLNMARSTGSDNIQFHDPKNMFCDSRGCDPQIQITVWDKQDEYIKKQLFDLSKKEIITIDGRESYKFFEPRGIGSAASFTFFIPDGSRIYEILYLSPIPDLIPSYEDIIKSFKFIETN